MRFLLLLLSLLVPIPVAAQSASDRSGTALVYFQVCLEEVDQIYGREPEDDLERGALRDLVASMLETECLGSPSRFCTGNASSLTVCVNEVNNWAMQEAERIMSSLPDEPIGISEDLGSLDAFMLLNYQQSLAHARKGVTVDERCQNDIPAFEGECLHQAILGHLSLTRAVQRSAVRNDPSNGEN